MTTDSGPLPVGNGEPGTAASAPLVLFIRRTETLLDPLFAVRRKLPCGIGVWDVESNDHRTISSDPGLDLV